MSIYVVDMKTKAQPMIEDLQVCYSKRCCSEWLKLKEILVRMVGGLYSTR